MTVLKKMGEIGKDTERGLMIASGAVVIALVGLLPGYDEPSSGLRIVYRTVFLQAIANFSLAFVLAITATYGRVMATLFVDSRSAIARLIQYVCSFTWFVAVPLSTICLIVSGFYLIGDLGRAARFESENVQGLPADIIGTIDFLSEIDDFLHRR